jgi:hypothetical protein
MRRSPEHEAHAPQRGELWEDGNKEHCGRSESDGPPYGGDDELFASFGNSGRALKAVSLAVRPHVADEEGAYEGGADVDPVDASDAKTE